MSENTLTYNKLLKIYEDIKQKQLDSSSMFCPFAKLFNNTYYISYTANEDFRKWFDNYKKTQEENKLYIENFFGFDSFGVNMGIELIPDIRIANNDFGLYYEDYLDANKLHPVLHFRKDYLAKQLYSIYKTALRENRLEEVRELFEAFEKKVTNKDEFKR